MKLVFATRNRGKIDELRALLAGAAVDNGLDVEILSLDEAGFVGDIVEDRDTFAGNAQKKAEAVCAAAQLPALADDSGLEVDALDGAPGVHSARYAGLASGEPGADAANIAHLLRQTAAFPPPRRARFRCVLALATPGFPTLFTEGVLEGQILDEPRGAAGFGYDPVFLAPPLGLTLAELSPDQKNHISHRAIALAAMVPHLRAAAARIP